jgi:uncharacterized protein DUF3500
MVKAALIDFLNTLRADQQLAVLFAFDSQERRNWHYIPKERNGIALKAMTEAQRQAAKALLRAALSDKGYARAEDIMWLENVLRRTEDDAEMYGPQNYVLSVFGDPSGGGPWGWRVDGHHLSLNFTHAAGGVAVTPMFYGANPATVPHGPRAGLRVLGAEEDLGRELIRALGDEQRQVATIAAKAPKDIVTGPEREHSLRQPVGLALGGMTEPHRHLAIRIVEEFIGTLRPERAEAERARLRDGGVERVHFGWAGALAPGQPHYYRLHGPTLIIEYDNTQNDANHIHSVWHDPAREFGDDLLRGHYQHGHRHD